jgi:thioredoxin reductase (NADPH)
MKKFQSILLGLACACAPIYGLEDSNEEKVYPVVILGGGVGALTSAVYLQRAGIETVVIEGQNPGGAIAQSPSVHNWPGEVEIDGGTLVEKIRNQASYNGATFRSEEVIHVDFSKNPLEITTRSVLDPEQKQTIYAKSAILATGSTPRFLGVPGESGENSYWTKGVYTCAVCDGALYKNKDVAVIGGGDSAIIEADYLSKIARKVYVIVRSGHFRTVEIMRKNELLARDNVEVLYETQVKEIQGDGQKVTHLVLDSKKDRRKNLNLDGVFVAIGAIPNTDLFKSKLNLDNNGYIKLKHDQETSQRGVFAIGDVADPEYKQAVSAAGDGAKAALQVESFLAGIPASQIVAKVASEATQTPKPAAEGAVEVTNVETFYSALKQGDMPVVVDFYSPYCGPCRQLAPKYEETAKKYGGKIKFFKVNVAEQNELASQYNIYAVPTLVVFSKEGKVIDRKSGLKDINDILKNLDSLTQ